jgi:hypothetical protein
MSHATDQLKEMEQLVSSTRRRTDVLFKSGMDAAHAADVNRMERSTSGLREAIKNPKLPRDFAQGVQSQIRDIELLGYRKYIDATLNLARRAAQNHDDKKKFALLKTVRDYLPKAISAGAGEDFRRDTLRVMEIVEFTGTPVTPPQGTKAKPNEKNAPPVPANRAKF